MKKSRSHSQNVFSSLALQSKLNFFREKYNESQDKFQTKYGWQIQSGRNKSAQKNRNFNNSSRKKQQKANIQSTKKTSSSKNLFKRLSGSGILNPQVPTKLMESTTFESKLLKDLHKQAQQMSGYAEENKQLLRLKATYQNRIKQLKMELAKQNKLLSEVNSNNGLLQNKIQEAQRRFNQANQRSLMLQDGIEKTLNEINHQKRRKMQNQAQKNYNNESIIFLEENNRKLNDIEISNTRVSLLKQENIRSNTKDKLLRQLKVMQNNAILHRQLCIQKQNIDNNLKKFVQSNRIEQQHMRLGVQSRISNPSKN